MQHADLRSLTFNSEILYLHWLYEQEFSRKSKKFIGNDFRVVIFGGKNLWILWECSSDITFAENSWPVFSRKFLRPFEKNNSGGRDMKKKFPHIAQGFFLTGLECVIHSRFIPQLFVKFWILLDRSSVCCIPLLACFGLRHRIFARKGYTVTGCKQ